MEGSELVRFQAGVLEVVLLFRYPVPLDVGMAGVHRLENERDAHLPEGVLVPLEGPPKRTLVLGVARKTLVQLLGREGPLGFEKGGDEIDEPFQPIHGGRSLRTASWPPWP